jgi:hypothetical protein
MGIRFTCSCGRELNVKDSLAGKRGKCPACGKTIQVPTAEQAARQVETPPLAAPAPEVEPETDTKSCVRCGNAIAVDAVFCIHCGTDLRTGRKHEADEDALKEREYDFFKVAPDMITNPMGAVGAIVEAPLTANNLKKGLIFLAIGMIFFTWVVPLNNREAVELRLGSGGISIWAFILTAILGLAVVVTDAIVCGVAGTMFGTTGVGLPNVFMAVLAARAVIGLAMIVPALYDIMPDVPMTLVMAWLPRAIRLLWGTGLTYAIIFRSYDCGVVPSLVFAVAATGVQAILFWLPGQFFGIWLI